MPVIDMLERIVRNTGRLSVHQAEERLKGILGEVYPLLCAEARSSLIAAEQICEYPEYRAPGDVVHKLATAFELQIKRVVLECFALYLRGRGVAMFPATELEGAPAILDGEVNRRATLGSISLAFRQASIDRENFCLEYGLELDPLRSSMAEVSPVRNRATHEVQMSPAEASEWRERWLGVEPRDGGIFGHVVSTRLSSVVQHIRPRRRR